MDKRIGAANWGEQSWSGFRGQETHHNIPMPSKFTHVLIDAEARMKLPVVA